MPTHHEKRHLPYKAQDIFAAIADIEAYPDFLPWCAGAKILTRTSLPQGEALDVDMVIRFKLFRERFQSQAALYPEKGTIKVRYIDGPFKYMESEWQIAPSDQGSEVEFFVDFQFRNIILKHLMGLIFHDTTQHIIDAFENRLADLYPPEAL